MCAWFIQLIVARLFLKSASTLLLLLACSVPGAAQQLTPEQMEEGMRLVKEFLDGNPVCESVLERIIEIMERDKSITPTAACVRALEIERRTHLH
jgi:hypothetical protein